MLKIWLAFLGSVQFPSAPMSAVPPIWLHIAAGAGGASAPAILERGRGMPESRGAMAFSRRAAHWSHPSVSVGNSSAHWRCPNVSVGNSNAHWSRPNVSVGNPSAHFSHPNVSVGNPSARLSRSNVPFPACGSLFFSPHPHYLRTGTPFRGTCAVFIQP